MSKADQQKFIDAVNDADSAWVFKDWKPAVLALNGLSMSDMLQALSSVTEDQRGYVWQQALFMGSSIGAAGMDRIAFGVAVVDRHEITPAGLPRDQTNDAREFLGCTRLDDAGVQFTIDSAINKAKAAIAKGDRGTEWATLGGAPNQCCGVIRVAWVPILVNQRRAKAGASLDANLAAAAHYMLARFHVCAAKATVGAMKTIIDGYDERKRVAFKLHGNLNSLALTASNPPFPVDFEIAKWAYKGADHGEADRTRCNSSTDLPTIPEVDGSEY
jgi:hypothetical protein